MTLTLAVDTGSPTISLALAQAQELLVTDAFPGGPASPPILQQIDEALSSIGAHVTDLGRVIAARGPGSFTGLRSGLAALLGLHQALGLDAVALPSFEALAAQVVEEDRVVAAVDALRGEWFVQPFELGVPLEEPSIVRPQDLLHRAPCAVVGFGVENIADNADRTSGIRFVEAEPLAPFLASIAGRRELAWDPATLISPLYLRPPAAKPAIRQGHGGASSR